MKKPDIQYRNGFLWAIFNPGEFIWIAKYAVKKAWKDTYGK